MKIAVAGTGYVGLVAGVCFAEKGHNVICVDIDENKVKLMKSGKSPIYEEGLEELLDKNYKEGRLDFTTDYKMAYRDADAIFRSRTITEVIFPKFWSTPTVICSQVYDGPELRAFILPSIIIPTLPIASLREVNK